MKIVIEGVSFAYQDRQILNGIQASLEPGTFTCVVGPNGTGKTTLFRLIMGELALQEGKIELQEDRRFVEPEAHSMTRTIAMLPQGVSDPPYVTVRELVALARSNRRNGWGWRLQDEDDELISSSMRRCSVEHMADQPFEQLSGGEKQRVWLAFCLAQRKEFLLMDEPLHALDYSSRWAFFDLLSQVAAEGHGVVITTHELDLAAEFADRVLVFRDGGIAYDGSPKEVDLGALVET